MKKTINSKLLSSKASPIQLLHQSEFYKVFDYMCSCSECGTSAKEYNTSFNICLSKKGNYGHNSFKKQYDIYNGIVLLQKPMTEYTITHHNPSPDETTVITFSKLFYEEIIEETTFGKSPFYSNQNLQAVALKSKPYWELLHHFILQMALHKSSTDKLKADMIVMELLNEIIDELCEPQIIKLIPAKIKTLHLGTVEKAKEYISGNFRKDLSLSEIACSANVSSFHFTRIFKQLTGYSPYRYLIIQRLNYASLLLKTTSQQVSEVCINAGFNTIEHFTTTFTEHYSVSPLAFRTQKSNIP